MKTLPIQGPATRKIVTALKRSDLFVRLDESLMTAIVRASELVTCDAGEAIIRAGDLADAFYILLSGTAAVLAVDGETELAILQPHAVLGELGLLLDEPRGATVVARDAVMAVRFKAGVFFELFDALDGFGLGFARALAHRIQDTSRVVLGEDVLRAPGAAPAAPVDAARLDSLLREMVEAGASDLHLTADHRPIWRVDGDMQKVSEWPRLDPEGVLELLGPVMPERNRREFAETSDTDFAYSIPDLARFRVNLFRDTNGVGSVMRVIPSKILSFDDLGLPESVRRFCEMPKGLVLVTGPTGSGKSTTLAAMIDHINATRAEHIITMEDPVEFVHRSRRCLVNQREVHSHTRSFSRALRAALREDPDIVLVGEMRDLETVSLALETAATGHLVFGTLHTTTAISTVDRIIEMFPSERQSQIRAVLSSSLVGVVAQTLCKKTGGGRIGVYEVMVVNSAVSNLIREGKTHQITSTMQTGRNLGNTLLNDELVRLVGKGLVTAQEAIQKTSDKKDLREKLAAADSR
jgi:twitching motility protein PilT